MRVALRVCPVDSAHAAFLNLDPSKNQVMVRDPSSSGIITAANKRTGVAAPKLFAFDGVYSQDHPLVSYNISVVSMFRKVAASTAS